MKNLNALFSSAALTLAMSSGVMAAEDTSPEGMSKFMEQACDPISTINEFYDCDSALYRIKNYLDYYDETILAPQIGEEHFATLQTLMDKTLQGEACQAAQNAEQSLMKLNAIFEKHDPESALPAEYAQGGVDLYKAYGLCNNAKIDAYMDMYSVPGINQGALNEASRTRFTLQKGFDIAIESLTANIQPAAETAPAASVPAASTLSPSP